MQIFNKYLQLPTGYCRLLNYQIGKRLVSSSSIFLNK